MYCTNCGKEIDENAMFCPYCGVAVSGNYHINNYNTNAYAPYSQPKKEYNILAILGFIFSFIGFFTLVMGIAGLACSIIGYRHAAKINAGKGLAVAGIVISIIAIIIQIICIIVNIADTGTYTVPGDYY